MVLHLQDSTVKSNGSNLLVGEKSPNPLKRAKRKKGFALQKRKSDKGRFYEMENEKKTVNRKRSIAIRFHVTEEEKILILAKSAIATFGV